MTEPHWRKRETKMIDVTSIKIEERILKPTKARVAAMAKSLSSDLGQLYPILITKHLRCWRVVAGATRLMAARELGWDQIEATIIGADNEYEYKLIEIAENLERDDLSDVERKRLKDKERELRAQRIEHFEKLTRGETPDAPPRKAKGGRGRKGGVRNAARKAGVASSTAHDQLNKLSGKSKPDSLGIDAPSEEQGAPAPKKPKREPAAQPQASEPTALSDHKVRCPMCGGQGWVLSDETEPPPPVDATATRH